MLRDEPPDLMIQYRQQGRLASGSSVDLLAPLSPTKATRSIVVQSSAHRAWVAYGSSKGVRAQAHLLDNSQMAFRTCFFHHVQFVRQCKNSLRSTPLSVHFDVGGRCHSSRRPRTNLSSNKPRLKHMSANVIMYLRSSTVAP